MENSDREKDILKLCNSVLDISTIFYDNPNGAYESTCPFCYATKYRGGGQHYHVAISDVKHENDCAYLIAKDLSTNLIK